MAQDGLSVGGDVVATTSAATGVSYGGIGQGVWPNFLLSASSTNTADVFFDISGGSSPIASTSADARLKPGKTFPPYLVSAAGRNTGYSGFSVVCPTAGQTVSWTAWR